MGGNETPGLPAPIAELARRTWDAVVVGAGHNGLTCAAYLARAGWDVLVLEARDRVGGAASVREPFPGYRLSPCAYLCGLLHPVVIDELDLLRRGLRWHPATAGMFVPFDDGSCVQLHDDPEAAAAEIARISPGDQAGWKTMTGLVRRVADAVRDPERGDLWLGPPPSPDEVADRVDRDPEAVALLFEWSMVDLVERYLDDERLQSALLGQGVIGTFASPHDAGTAFVHLHHSLGRMPGHHGAWGWVDGGIGQVSFLLADAAIEAGALVATGTPVATIRPAEGPTPAGVVLAGGERISARHVVSNADPRATLGLLGDTADTDWRAAVTAVPQEGCTVKLNVALDELPDFRARPGTNEIHHRGQVNIPLGKQEWQTAFDAARAGGLPDRLWCELYFQSPGDPTVAPPGRQVMSVFAQYVPHTFAEGDWEHRRDEVGRLALDSIAAHCTNLPAAIEAVEVKGPPDIEEAVGLTGGHIFQGECLPEHMWDRRLATATPMPGVWLCGAATHPGGSVMAINGRNAAMALLHETALLHEG